MSFNAYLLLRGADGIMGYGVSGAYAQATAQTQKLVKRAEDETASFFRLENLAPRSLNDAFSVGYFGVSHFSSLFEKETLDTMTSLGYTQQFYGLSYTDCIPARDTLFGISYQVPIALRCAISHVDYSQAGHLAFSHLPERLSSSLFV